MSKKLGLPSQDQNRYEKDTDVNEAKDKSETMYQTSNWRSYCKDIHCNIAISIVCSNALEQTIDNEVSEKLIKIDQNVPHPTHLKRREVIQKWNLR